MVEEAVVLMDVVEEEYLRRVVLSDDNKTILLNGELKYAINLPLNMMSNKKLYTTRWHTLKTLILNGCHSMGLDELSDENVTKLAKEVLDTLIERRKFAKAEEQRIGKEHEEDYENISSNTAGTAQLSDVEQQKIQLTPELTRELSFDETADIFSVSIKRDKVNKLISFSGMLLAQTNKDQLNIGFQAESAAGKSYIPSEIASYFPTSEVMKIASASPTAFYHKGGKWDDARKAVICDLEHKIIIFSDQPHFQLLEKMRSVLSKDDKELTYWITDKNKSGANRTKTIIIRGFASVFFCTAKTDPDEQEKTRLILLSPETGEDKLFESLELAALRNADTDVYRSVIEQDPKRKWLINRILAIRQSGIRDIIVPDGGKSVFDRFILEHKHLIARHQRDLPRIFGFIKAHALLNCFNRERLTNGKSGAVVANDTDIEAGFALYKEIEESNELGLSPYIYRIYSEVIKPNLNGNGVSRKELRSKYFSVFHKFLPPKFEESVIAQIEAAGLILQEPDEEDRRKILIRLPARDGDNNNSSQLPASEPEKYIPHDSGHSNNSDQSWLPSLSSPPPTVSGDISPVGSIKEITKKLVGDKGFFTKAEWMTALMLLPRQDPLYCDEDQADQTLQGLIDDSMIEEFEPGKYRPTEKLREQGGD
jgi:hypothetical protein